MIDKANVPLDEKPWYAEVTRYQWLVLIIASAGWIFDVYEGQIFNITRNQMLTDIVGGDSAGVKQYGDVFLGIFLLGGTCGGLIAGSLADRFGRRPIMVVTILMYSIFSSLTYFATELWHVGLLRFLVALGVGGEWAVAASLVSEVFPARARAHASGIFHASSVLGIWAAALAGMAVGTHWRYAYLIGLLPALLILWIRSSMKEPQKWQETAEAARINETAAAQLGSFKDLLLNRAWSGRAVLGMMLAAVGLGTFWAITVAGQDLAREMLLAEGVDPASAAQRAKFAYGIVQTAASGLGLVSFGPLCARFGRRRTFIAYHVISLIIVPITCLAPGSYSQLIWLLPVMGFFTLGIHAGYAIYFPELFPTHLRATGTSFCFNGGRLLAVPVLLFSGWLKAIDGMELHVAMTWMSLLFVLGIVIMLRLPETNRQELIE